MKTQAAPPLEEPRRRRLPWDARHQDLMEKALDIVRQDGADALTLGTLAQHGGVSKPVVYDHFESRSSLLTALYRWIDAERKRAFQEGMAKDGLAHEPTIHALSETYIRCATDASSEFFAVGAAMTGNEERARIYRELEETGVQMFEAILRPHVRMPDPELHLLCIALVGAGESLSASTLKGAITEAEAIATYAQLIGLATKKGSGRQV